MDLLVDESLKRSCCTPKFFCALFRMPKCCSCNSSGSCKSCPCIKHERKCSNCSPAHHQHCLSQPLPGACLSLPGTPAASKHPQEPFPQSCPSGVAQSASLSMTYASATSTDVVENRSRLPPDEQPQQLKDVSHSAGTPRAPPPSIASSAGSPLDSSGTPPLSNLEQPADRECGHACVFRGPGCPASQRVNRSSSLT